MFLKNLRMSRLMNANDGAGTGEANTGNADPAIETPPAEPTQTEKTFTQADVDKLIQDRIAREKKNQLSKEELKAYQDWKESQKTEEEKRNEALESEKSARIKAEEKATLMEAKLVCASNGVKKENIDDVIALARTKVTEEITLEQAISMVVDKYPDFKLNKNAEPIPQVVLPTGGKTGSSDEITKDKFKKMNYKQRLELFNTNKALYDLLSK